MPPIDNLAFASSSIKDFDLVATVAVAQENEFDSVQLYLNNRYYPDEIELELLLVQLEKAGDIDRIIIHLPNIDKYNSNYANTTELIMERFPNREVRALIHYEEGMTVDQVPVINGKRVGIENSLTGVYDLDHVARARKLAIEADSFFVFDFGRIMYPYPDGTLNKIIQLAEIERIIDDLEPTDILHVSAKSEWGIFKDFSVALGDPKDITIPLIEAIKRFMERGGLAVLEHEDLRQALQSQINLEKYFEN